MPRGDGTGPNGMGSMTGRGAGYCAGANAPGFASGVGRGAGMGRGRGAGRGFRNMFYATGLPGWQRGGNAAPYGAAAAFPNREPEPEIQALANQAQALKAKLDAIEKRLAALGAEADT